MNIPFVLFHPEAVHVEHADGAISLFHPFQEPRNSLARVVSEERRGEPESKLKYTMSEANTLHSVCFVHTVQEGGSEGKPVSWVYLDRICIRVFNSKSGSASCKRRTSRGVDPEIK